MPFAAAAPLIPVSFICSVRIAVMHNGAPCPAGIAVVRNVRTMKQTGGLTGNRPNYCLFPISW
jgi:hypothetical protein